MTTTRRTIVAAGAAFAIAGAPAYAQRRPEAPERVDIAELMQAGPLGDMVLGNAQAPVTLVEYASLTCGHCATFHTGTLPGLKSKYIDAGRVRLVFREFPLNPLDIAASMLARCVLGEQGAAGDQSRYFAVVEVLFNQQRTWAFGSNPEQALRAIFRQAGLSQQAFDACLDNQATLTHLNTVRERAQTRFQVDSTPSFFLNGRRVLGALPLAEFERLIDPLLPA